MTTPTVFMRTASAEMYATFEQLDIQLQFTHAIRKMSRKMSRPMATTPEGFDDEAGACDDVFQRTCSASRSMATTPEGQDDEAGACYDVFKRTRSAGRQHAPDLGTAGGKFQPIHLHGERPEPYTKSHVHLRSNPRKDSKVPSDSGGVAAPFVNDKIPRDFYKRFGQAIRAEREAALAVRAEREAALAVTALPEAFPARFSHSGTPAQSLPDTRRNRFMRP
jgi:hypothetical protein